MITAGRGCNTDVMIEPDEEEEEDDDGEEEDDDEDAGRDGVEELECDVLLASPKGCTGGTVLLPPRRWVLMSKSSPS